MANWIFMKLYPFVVHYLQMCMKEYGCCPKFKRGDNSTYTITVNQECLFNYMTSQYQISLRVESMTQWKQVSSLKVFLAETKGKIYLINIITTVAFWI
jgi:hypothetical protein